MPGEFSSPEQIKRSGVPTAWNMPWGAEQAVQVMPVTLNFCFIGFTRLSKSDALRPPAPSGASRAFCRRQNLDARRIQFARADKKIWGPRSMKHAVGSGAGCAGHACYMKLLLHKVAFFQVEELTLECAPGWLRIHRFFDSAPPRWRPPGRSASGERPEFPYWPG